MANHEAIGRRSKAHPLGPRPESRFGRRSRRPPASICRCLAVLLAVTPVAATAAELQDSHSAPSVSDLEAAPGGGFTLGLDAALRGQMPDAPALDRLAAASAPAEPSGPIAAIDLRRIAVPMRQQAPAAAAEPNQASSGGFGKWLKRHWWVPALVGAAVLATAGEDLYDDDDDGDDDD